MSAKSSRVIFAFQMMYALIVALFQLALLTIIKSLIVDREKVSKLKRQGLSVRAIATKLRVFEVVSPQSAVGVTGPTEKSRGGGSSVVSILPQEKSGPACYAGALLIAPSSLQTALFFESGPRPPRNSAPALRWAYQERSGGGHE